MVRLGALTDASTLAAYALLLLDRAAREVGVRG